jgi:rare lipoprotein A
MALKYTEAGLSALLRSTLTLSAIAVGLASCVATGPKVARVKKARPTEYFAESVLGVKASPRVVNVALASMTGGQMKRLPRGGGRDMVGRPYQVRGKWYYPREDLNYMARGTASWYGDAFHGRLTANGEVYDMNNLTAAHPTMPLPSYARVTNIANGKSVIVRVNDRGPYAGNRLIDLSKHAAQMLDYTHFGTAQVQLEYIGRAPVHGLDDEYLLASYRENGATGPGEIQPGVMVAMNGSEAVVSPALQGEAFAPALKKTATAMQAHVQSLTIDGAVMGDTRIRGALPENASALVNRPNTCVTLEPCEGIASDGLLNGYADVPKLRRASAFDALGIGNAHSITVNERAGSERVLLGSFTVSQGIALKSRLRDLALVTFDNAGDAGVEVYAKPVGAMKMDDLLRKLWDRGFDNAFVVR